MKTLIILLLILFSAQAQAQAQEWDTVDYTLLTCNAIAVSLDAYTTHRGLDQGGYEKNPIQGKHPSDARIAGYALLTLGGRTFVAYYLPDPWRKIFLTLTFGWDLYFVRHNYIWLKKDF